jgi:hypothetical protein
MRIQLPYVAVELDDRVRERLAHAGDRFRINVTAYMRSAADDLGEAGGTFRAMCDTAAARVNAAMAAVTNKIAHAEADSERRPT